MYKVLILVLALAGCGLAAIAQSNKNIVHPCRPITNQCVGDNLAANSKCNKKNLRGLPNAYEYGELRFETPYFNASYIDLDLQIKGHDKCYVSEFFFNIATDVAVLSVDCPYITLASNRTLIQHYSLQEDKIYSYTSTWEYPLIRMTTNIPRADIIDICNAFVFTDITQLPKFILTPNDEPTKDFLSQDLSFLNIYEREMGFYKGNLLFRSFISSYVCDFGCLI